MIILPVFRFAVSMLALAVGFGFPPFLSTIPTLICKSLLLSNDVIRRNLDMPTDWHVLPAREPASKAVEVFDRTDSEFAELG
jgi:hypothetical protein